MVKIESYSGWYGAKDVRIEKRVDVPSQTSSRVRLRWDLQESVVLTASEYLDGPIFIEQETEHVYSGQKLQP